MERVKVRRPFVYLALLGVLLLLFDRTQSWVYLHRAPQIPETYSSGEGAVTRAILVAGQGMDEVESATCRRDLANAVAQLQCHTEGRLIMESFLPGREDYSNASVLAAIERTDCQDLLIYLTGHGGGVNFGAGGGLNLRREALAEALSQARFQRATVVEDCCWSGEFIRSFQGLDYPGEVTLITSTDAKHPAPFPVSFLSPGSFGKMLFDRWEAGPEAAFQQTNAYRKKLEWLYDEKFGLEGVWWRNR